MRTCGSVRALLPEPCRAMHTNTHTEMEILKAFMDEPQGMRRQTVRQRDMERDS